MTGSRTDAPALATPAQSRGMEAAAKKIGVVLFIDDNDTDHLIFERKAKRSGLIEHWHSFFYAYEALDFLRRPDCPAIDAVFLDINMPRMSGFEFLERAMQEFGDDFAAMVVVMFTTSPSQKDRARAMQFPAVKKYFNKPIQVEHIEEIADFLWDGAKGHS